MKTVLRLRVLGTVSAEGDAPDEPDALLAQPKVLALLAYLTLARPHGFQLRDRLVGLFWPELDQEHARTALRKLLHRLRQHVGDGFIIARGTESLSIDREALWCDALAFQEAIAEDRLQAALDLYQGELMPGFFVPGSGEFGRWIEDERAYYKERAVSTAWELVERYAGEQALTNATQLARLVARLAPTDERMLRRVITMLAKLGDRAGAVHIYSSFCDRLWKDFETRPSAETLQLVERVQRGAEL